MEPVRVEPPTHDAEPAMLVGYLEHERASLERICAGLTAEQLADRAVPPSALSLCGLVRHMADVERIWFRCRLEGADLPWCFRTAEDGELAFLAADAAGFEQALATWREECRQARAVVARHQLEEIAPWLRNGEQISLRWIMLHMIDEYARHLGHADLLRERLDGATAL